MKKIGVIDYGAANIENVVRAVRFLDKDVELISDPNQMANCSHLILPGVGAFPFGLAMLAEKGFVESLRGEAQRGKPVLGICLGMQLLFEQSEEFEVVRGLALFEGYVKSLGADFERGNNRIPRIGWYPVTANNDAFQDNFFGNWNNQYFYFAHSYYVKPTQSASQLVTLFGSNPICAGYKIENLIGVQFHPEKSGKIGLSFLNAFLSI